MLVISWSKATGAQMRSILLGVIVFMIVARPKKATANQIPTCEIDFNCGKSKSALDNTSNARKAKMAMLIMATNLILGGYFPGYFPPIDAAPHGTPAAKHP